jgi:hypothetical protein
MLSLPAMTETRAQIVMRVAQTVSGILVAIGMLGLLRTNMRGSDGETVTLFHVVIDPASTAIYLVLGIVGTAMAVRAARARRFVIGLAALMVLWALVAVALRGWPSDAVSGEPSVILLHLGLAALAIAPVAWPEQVAGARLADPDQEAEVSDIPLPPHVQSRMEQAATGSEEASMGVAPESEPPAHKSF